MRKRDFALIDAARTENLNDIKTALTAAADVHAGGDAAPYWSASYGRVEAIRLLLATGADVVKAWQCHENEHKETTMATLDAAADVMTPGQRAALMAMSTPREFAGLRAAAASANQRYGLQR